MWAIIRGNVSHHFHLNLFKTLKIYHWLCFIKITGFSKKKKKKIQEIQIELQTLRKYLQC